MLGGLPASRAAKALSTASAGARVLTRAGVVRPYGPGVLAGLAVTLRRWGTGAAGGFSSLATRAPHQVGLVDELGELTWADLVGRAQSLARALAGLGVGEGDRVALLCRNHRGFVETTIAVSMLGADVLYLNTAFAGPQLRDVLARDAPAVVVHDEEFTPALLGIEDGVEDGGDGGGAGTEPAAVRVVAWTDTDAPGAVTTEQLIASHERGPLTPPGRNGRTVILTSGTTGTPKGAPRAEAGIDAGVSLLSALPLRAGWRTHVAAPLFHTWGYGHLALSMLLGSTLVLARRFEPQACLDLLRRERCDSFVVVPVMLQRILALPEEQLAAADLSRVQVVASSGSALPGDLPLTWMDRFGDRLWSTYGSTEVAYASVASPQDLRAAPGTAGRPPWNTEVRVLGDDLAPVPRGTTGRIFVGNGLLFEGYTGGGSKEVVDGLMATGDVGRVDEAGRLVVEGRDDDMIVSGGENVFPQEVEDCIARMPGVAEVAVVGVADPDFGQRLRAFVVAAGAPHAGAAGGGGPTAEEVQQHVRDNLARYKVPRDVVRLDALPRNATGKVLKRELPHPETSPEP
ncbi:AMP-binding protein [Nocardioides bruguierae]|uniref:AMP-binding protein n=1 Tax=Nocardioides bruguierae TaxID=2945102 RepID=A0A9X2D578_9ACTN|nr:AMP-binding protein [Nocardioides bruguierae]MCM0619413.1 AMP-binding protein [Nocardioides bruguierae]